MFVEYNLYNNNRIFFESPDDGNSYFFGYYDKSPLNKANTKVLAHKVDFDGRDVQDGDIAEVGYFDLTTNEFIKIDDTLAWNWQQGSQLQWLPPNYDIEVIYNSILNNKFVSIIFNINTKEKRIIPFSIYSVHPNGKEALAVNYERHFWCRHGYNYQNIKNNKWDVPHHEEDGVYHVDLITGNVKLIIKIVDIINHNNLPEFDISNNWLEHLMYNPSGNRFMFFHRWNKDGIDHSRVYTANSRNGQELASYPDVRFYSHYYWQSDEDLSIWAHEPEKKINSNFNWSKSVVTNNTFLKHLIKPFYRVLKPIIPKKIKSKIKVTSKLLVFRDRTNEYTIVGDDILYGNGHQSWFGNKEILLNDTYQDSENYRHLMKFDITSNKIEFIGKFYSKYNDCGYRCDLHPRLSSNNNLVVIDSSHTEKRKLLVIEIGKD